MLLYAQYNNKIYFPYLFNYYEHVAVGVSHRTMHRKHHSANISLLLLLGAILTLVAPWRSSAMLHIRLVPQHDSPCDENAHFAHHAAYTGHVRADTAHMMICTHHSTFGNRKTAKEQHARDAKGPAQHHRHEEYRDVGTRLAVKATVYSVMCASR
eukprot:COSAG01_NODE_14081_length_1498_cov_1.721944_3_plen_155_part_00